MNVFESIKSSFKSVFSNKMRALLTMLGIIIGIGSVIMITSIGEGTQAQMKSQFESFGVGRISISNARSPGTTISDKDRLNLSDEDALRESDHVRFISPTYSGSGVYIKLADPTETKQASVTGVGADYKDITKPEILYGRYINDSDVDQASKVVVIQDTTAEKIFGYSDCIGEKVTLRRRGSQKYTVIGVTKNSNAQMAAMFGDNFPEEVTMPISTAHNLFATKEVSNFTIIVSDPDNSDAAASELTAILEQKHQNTDKYYVQDMMQQLETVNSMLGTVTTVISLIAGISLVVGGIGVMNIMLVTVTERTREIGIRKSIGARNNDIRVQFIIEALIITSVGGALGILLGIGGGRLAANAMSMQSAISMSAILLAVGISTAIGLIFGVYPANKAAKLDPIEALRYE